ncbi:DinB family protein [Terrimonas sp. NA20]|uniref:DinB family protein n=1 Tax=Terrimonas ginsenosidimutans TaxID=2908004 RepID=A0ABS9KLJ6_9BACT|nr:DinB family protein [Terrimonas ginsenosidimutans]MCG2613181.1 DinB family protein [Terrimonas ginsenosidimutans]
MLTQTAATLEALLLLHIGTLRTLSTEELLFKPSAAKWSKLQIIGHLADSAQNNIRRFIVAQYEENPFIVYNQDKWVEAVGYQGLPPADVIDLWFLLNKQIVQILRRINSDAYHRVCTTGEPHTLEWLAADYVKHLKYHLHQVLDLEPFPYP